MGCERIGHGGASALVRANTLASFDAACEIGVDMVEFDVRAWDGELVLAHTILHARRGGNLRLRDALGHLAGPRFSDVRLNVDVKHVGCEAALLDQLREAALLDRTLISSQVPGVVDRVRALDPSAWVGISIGGRMARINRRWRDWRAGMLAGLQSGRWDAVMAQHRLVDGRLLGDVNDRGGRLYAWTVNERAAIARLQTLGVHGIATADPRLFA
ncbi:MAG TPA: glycerophosphodiester phosphodiesterase [Solirubrobacteraceae bacterium]|jgi:glycerophosphoryl diester phosphodiesterase